MTFPQVVLDGERVIGWGEVTALDPKSGTADCTIRLEHAGRGVLLAGEATVLLPG